MGTTRKKAYYTVGLLAAGLLFGCSRIDDAPRYANRPISSAASVKRTGARWEDYGATLADGSKKYRVCPNKKESAPAKSGGRYYWSEFGSGGGLPEGYRIVCGTPKDGSMQEKVLGTGKNVVASGDGRAVIYFLSSPTKGGGSVVIESGKKRIGFGYDQTVDIKGMDGRWPDYVARGFKRDARGEKKPWSERVSFK